MFDRDHFQEIFLALGSNKLRTLLTAFGVFWGVFMLVFMLGSGNGLQNGVYQDFGVGATNSFFVWTRATTKPYRGLPVGRRFNLSNADIAAIRQQVPAVDLVAPRSQLSGFRGGYNVTRGTRSGAFEVMGDTPDFNRIRPVRITHGRFINPLDVEHKRKVASIGARVAEVLFEEGEDPLGESIRIQGVHFRVVGVFESYQSDEDANDDLRRINLPFSTYQQAFSSGDAVGWFAITSRDGVPASVAEEQVLDLLRRRHRVHPDDPRAFGHFNLEEEFNQIRALFLSIRLLIWIVGVGTLAAGVIGVSNIMLVVVRERTNEIGIRRAVGATPWAITSQVVLEALILTSIAGYAGMMAGMGVLELISFLIAGSEPAMFPQPDVSLDTALKALLILVLSGALSGLMPARRAVKIRPVEALRSY